MHGPVGREEMMDAIEVTVISRETSQIERIVTVEREVCFPFPGRGQVRIGGRWQPVFWVDGLWECTVWHDEQGAIDE